MLTFMQLPFARSRSRRQGQALILAVLVMLFAVLLSSAFLVVIGNSGRQVGRETERTEASRNADKGVDFVIARLRASSSPDSWYPAGDPVLGVPPSPADADYGLYYSPLDKAMGWATTTVPITKDSYAKYPDPRSSRQAPQFLVSSHLLGTNAADDAEGGDKRFMLRITVIGLSSKNPDLWSRRTLYKSTNWNGGTFSYANFVTSFDPKTRKSIESTLKDAPTVTGTNIDVSIYASKGQGNEQVTYSPQIAEVGNTLMISNGQTEPLVGIVSNSQTNANVYKLTLRVLKGLAGATNFGADSKIALVGSLFESPANIDEDGDGAGVPATNEGPTEAQPVVSVSADTTPYTSPFGNGAQFNNGVNVPLTTIYAARPAVQPTAGSPTVAGQNALTSNGPVSVGDSSTTTTQVLSLINTQALPTPLPFSTPAPGQNQFVRVGFDASGTLRSDTASSPVAPAVAPRMVKPAPLDFTDYRAKAISTVSGLPYYTISSSGFYLNNPGDVEKFNGQTLTASQLQRLWQRKSFSVASGGNVVAGSTGFIASGTTGARLCYGRPNPDATGVNPGGDQYLFPMTTGGLEARGIRGWTSPWEYLPRGAQIILKDTAITVISDPLSDSSPNAPDSAKAFDVATRKFDLDIPATAVTQPYIICAEGNLRVSGNWNSNSPLTIVSNNNIYIEGKLTTRNGTTFLPGRLALLSKKNVVLNPTQFVSRPVGTVDTSVGKDILTAEVQGGAIQESANKNFKAAKFKFGDKVSVFKRGLKANGWYQVNGFNSATNPTSIQLSPALSTTDFPNGTEVKVKLVCDPAIVLLRRDDKTNGTNPGDIAATEHFIAGTNGKEANTQELDPTLNPASAGSSYVYKFAVGGDTLVRNVLFANNQGTLSKVGVAFNQAAQKSVVKFTVRGGDDKNPGVPNAANEDDGVRQLSVRPSAPNKIDLLMKPKPGAIKDQQTFDLQDSDGDGSPDTTGDATLGLRLDQFNIDHFEPYTAREQSRWLIEGIRDANGITGTGYTTARRLAQGDISFTVPANSKQANGEETPNDPTKFRVPLTSSVLLFAGSPVLNTTTPTAPEDASATDRLYRVGSAFGFRGSAIDPATDEEQESVKNGYYGNTPQWNIPVGGTGTNSVTYAQAHDAGLFAFTRDGAGDYDDRLPSYYLAGLRFQRVSGANSIAPATPDATIPDKDIKANMTVEVDATIYAEGGSWFVIPVPASVAPTASRGADQQIEWRRPNYNININGNITQMMTPTSTVDYDDEPDPDGVATGAMKRWTDSLSYQIYNPNSPTTPLWKTISYRTATLPAFATDPATGAALVDASGNPILASIPQLPSSSDILYTYSN